MSESGRRRPPLRSDGMDMKPRMKSPESPKSVSDDLPERSNRCEEVYHKEVNSVIQLFVENHSVDLDILESNVRKAVDYFESLNSLNEKRTFISASFNVSLEDTDVATQAAMLYGIIHAVKFEDETVRSLLLSSIQTELEDNDFRTGDRMRFRNAVFLLSEMYYHIRFGDQPVTVLGAELLKYFRWLLTGEDEEFEVLATCIIVNGLVLKKDKPASYRKLLLEIRTVLVTRNLTPLSKSLLLLIVDMDNVNFGNLPEELLMCYMTMIGDERFPKFKRVRPTIVLPSSNKHAILQQKTNHNRQVTSCLAEVKLEVEDKDELEDKNEVNHVNHEDKHVSLPHQRSPHQSPERRPIQRQVRYDERQSHERPFSDKPHRPSGQRSSEGWHSPERRDSSDTRSSRMPQSSNERQSSNSQKTISRVQTRQQKLEAQNQSRRSPPPCTYSLRPFRGSRGKRNTDLWTEPSVQANFNKDKKIPVWQHEHDDRFNRDYNS